MTKTKKNVYLFQPNSFQAEGAKVTKAWIPYSAGCIWSYAAQFDDINENFELKYIFYLRNSIDNILSKMDNPAVCGFSTYIWNINWSLYTAKMIKQRWPNCVIAFGGPQVNGKYLKYNQIDSIIMGEGEEPFLELLRDLVEQKPIQTFYKQSRLDKLDYPSPYASGVFDGIVSESPEMLWSAVLETNRGCPYHCTFCDWGSINYSKVKKFNVERVWGDVDWMAKNRVHSIWSADANFGIFRDRDLAIAQMVRKIADQKGSMINDIQFQWAKNSNDIVFEIAKELGNHCPGITLSLQSESETTLNAIKRVNMKSQNLQHMLELSEQYQIPTYTELIMALPEETLESWKQGLANILELGQHGHLDIYLASLLENSELNSPETRQRYKIKSTKFKHGDNNSPEEAREVTEFVASTSTLSTDDIAEGWAYGWMYQNIHSTGYTQIIAKYLRFVHKVPYRAFYDQLYTNLLESQVFGDILSRARNHMKYRLDETYRTGPEPKQVSFLESMQVARLNFEHTIELALKTAENLSISVPESIIKFQRAFIFDPEQTYPITIDVDYNVKTWENQPQTLEITPRGLGVISLVTRRSGAMKNFVKVVDCKHPNQ